MTDLGPDADWQLLESDAGKAATLRVLLLGKDLLAEGAILTILVVGIRTVYDASW